jgi:hypothetical protein
MTRAGQHVIGVGAGNHETRPELDQFTLRRGVVADTADPQHPVIVPTGRRHTLIGGAQPRMVDLSRDTDIGRQVTRAGVDRAATPGCPRRAAGSPGVLFSNDRLSGP